MRKIPTLFDCPLYVNMKRRVAKKYLNRWMRQHFSSDSKRMWNWIAAMENVKEGDLVHTCSGFNGKIIEITPQYRSVGNGAVLVDVDLWTTTGGCSALCCGVGHPITYEQAQESLRRVLSHPNAKEYGWDKRYENAIVNQDGTVTISGEEQNK